MNSPAAHLPKTLAARVAGSLGNAWRAIVDAASALRFGARASDADALDREALAALGEHMLKDIGASAWLDANAAACSRDDLPARIDMGLGYWRIG